MLDSGFLLFSCGCLASENGEEVGKCDLRCGFLKFRNCLAVKLARPVGLEPTTF